MRSLDTVMGKQQGPLAWLSAQAQTPDISLWRRTEQPTVLATELRHALIAHAHPCNTRVELLVEHQLTCFLQSKLLLVLQRAHPRDFAEVLPEGRWTHVHTGRQLVHAERSVKVELEP